jgi:hypothetical protein
LHPRATRTPSKITFNPSSLARKTSARDTASPQSDETGL